MDVRISTFIDENNCEEIFSSMEVIREVGVGVNGTKMVKLADQSTGFFKNSSGTTNASLDHLEFFISTMGNYILGMSLAEVSKVYNGDEYIGIISKNVAKEDECLIMVSDVFDSAIKLDRPEVKLLISKMSKIREENKRIFRSDDGTTKEFPVLEDEEDIVEIINLFPNALELVNIPKDERKLIVKDYFKMIVFDLLINQMDRTNNNYGIIHNRIDNTTRFAPLFDNSAIYIPGLPEDHVQLNGILINRKKMIECLIDNFGEYVLDVMKPIVENEESIVTRTDDLAKKTLSVEEQNWFMSNFKKNISDLSTIYKEKTSGNKK